MFTLVLNFLNDLLADSFQGAMEMTFNYLIKIGFYADQFLMEYIPALNIMGGKGVYAVTLSLGIVLVLLKFLKKGFDTYILWLDGDADVDPFGNLVGLIKALAVAVCFPTVYGWIAGVVTEFCGVLMNRISVEGFFNGGLLEGATQSIVSLLMLVIFAILYFVFYVKYIMTGLELFVLRCGVPIACIGLIDSNGGIWKSYFNKLFQCCATVVIQIIMLNVGLWLCLKLSPIWGVACLLLAIRTPRFLQEFLVVPQSGNLNAAMHYVAKAASLANSARAFRP